MEKLTRLVYRTRSPELDLTALNSRNSGSVSEVSEIMERSPSSAASVSPAVTEDVMFVALGNDVKESEEVLFWALHNSRGFSICILHVHQPAKKMPILGTSMSIDRMNEQEVEAYHQIGRDKMQATLDKYIRICNQTGVRSEKIWKEMDSIEKGIVQLISENGIKWLVMGAAADRYYFRKMKELKSKKAIYVRDQAPSSCHIWFTCKGNLIHTRESKPDSINMEAVSSQYQASPYAVNAFPLRSHSVAEGNSQIRPEHSLNYRRVRSNSHVIQHNPFSSSEGSSLQRNLNPEKIDGLKSPSISSHFSSASSDIIDHPVLNPPRPESDEIQSELPMFQPDHHPSVADSAIEGHANNELYHRLSQFMEEAESSRKEAYEESVRRRKVEKEVISAIRRAKEYETMYTEERRRRIETEEAMDRTTEEASKIKWQLNEALDKFRVAQEQTHSLQCQIADSERMVDDLKQKFFSSVEGLQNYKKEMDELEAERDTALRLAAELKEKLDKGAASTSSSEFQFFSEFSFPEIQEATGNFSEVFKIGEGGYGSIYRGILRHTQVAIKVLCPDSLQGPVEFRQEVNILSRLRHPNIVNLIGACPEASALIYEYLPNGSLEDRLICKNNSPPLSWKTRVHIAAELCSALIFLHSSQPQGIAHGDLKPSNILLDSNFVCKLSDFGICRQLIRDKQAGSNGTQFWRTECPKGTLVYIDPEFLATGELTLKSDVYSFGIILLRLLTGMPALRIAKEVQSALDKGLLKEILDPTAGDWPFVQAKQLAHLALSCLDANRRVRPELASEVWKVVGPMKLSCSSVNVAAASHRPVPSYFACPIFQEVMQDPVVAGDGYSYELEAVKGWLESGHDTSPMTNLKLPHCNLLPNHALRSAIQEWLHTPKNDDF